MNLRKFFLLVVFIMTLATLPISATAQENLNTSSTSPAPQINSQNDKVQTLRDKKNELTGKITTLDKENKDIEDKILDQTKTKQELEEIIIADSNRIIELNRNTLEDPTLKQVIEKEKQETTTRIANNQEKVSRLSNDINQLNSKVIANDKTIESINSQFPPLDEELDKELNLLQSQVVILGISVSKYLLLIISFWLFQQITKFITFKLTKNEVIRSLVVLISTLLAITGSIFTVLIAFIGNLPFLLTSLGVVSAAMVVALQEFISSFFAWFVIQIRGPYRLGDLIQIQTNVEIYTGVVKNIGIFRTELREKVGGESLDKEQLTGKIVDFPNNMILKHPVKNFTLDNNILWHNIDIVVTFESDYKEARGVLEKILTNYFVMAIDHKDDYLDDVYNLKTLYQPRLYFSIAQDGPCYTLWFAAKAGKLREVVEKISMQMLTEFEIKGIDIAYKTSRVIPTGDYDKPSKFYLNGQH